MTPDAVVTAARTVLRNRLDSGAGWDPGFDVDASGMRFEKCGVCGYVRYPRATFCPQCLSKDVVMCAASGAGSIWSFAVYHRAFHPAFADALPYAVALVELAEGPRLIGAVLDSDGSRLAVRQPVRAVPRELATGQFAVFFEVVPE